MNEVYMDDRLIEDIPLEERDKVCKRKYGMTYKEFLNWEKSLDQKPNS